MTGAGLAEMVAFFGLILLLTKPLGVYMARVFEGERTLLSRVFRPLERLVYRLTSSGGWSRTHCCASRASCPSTPSTSAART